MIKHQKNSPLLSKIIITGILSALLLTYNNCSDTSENRDFTLDSPFDAEPVIIRGLQQNSKTSPSAQSASTSDTLPKDFPLTMILKDECMKERKETLNSRTIKYWTDDFFQQESSNRLSDEADPFRESLFLTKTTHPINVESLKKLVRRDPCIVGITDTDDTQGSLANYNDPGFSQQRNLATTEYNSLDQNFHQIINQDIRVRVAVIDSGYDFSSKEQGSISPFLQGTDYIENDDSPQDENGHGTQVSNILFAKRNNNSGIVGLSQGLIEVLPIRAQYNHLFDAVKRSVNMGAEIINVSMSGVSDREYDPAETRSEQISKDSRLQCSPIHGHAFSKAVKRGVFIGVAAGHGTSYTKYSSGKHEGCYKYFQTDLNGKILLQKDQPVLCPKLTAGGMRGKNGQPRCLVPNLNGKENYKCSTKLEPGPIYSPKNNGPAFFGNTAQIACWGRFMKGVMTVGSYKNPSELSKFSNWGNDGVEIVAPGEKIATVGLNNKLEVVNGTSFAAPHLSYAAAVVIGFFKQKKREQPNRKEEWHYDPWLIEDILNNSSEMSPQFISGNFKNVDTKIVVNGERYLLKDAPDAEQSTVSGRILNYRSLYNYLNQFGNQNFEQRRTIASDNTEIGAGFNPDNINSSDIVGLQVYPESSFNQNKGRVQMQAVALYSNGSTQVITDQVTWISKNSAVTINASGIAFSDLDFEGSVIFEAHLGKTKGASSPIFFGENNSITGTGSLIPEDLKININEITCSRVAFNVIASYQDGVSRNVHKFASISASDGARAFTASSSGALINRLKTTRSGTEVKITAFYYGKIAEATYTAPTCRLLPESTELLVHKAKRASDGFVIEDKFFELNKKHFSLILEGPLETSAEISVGIKAECLSGCTNLSRTYSATSTIFPDFNITKSSGSFKGSLKNLHTLALEFPHSWYENPTPGSFDFTYEITENIITLADLKFDCTRTPDAVPYINCNITRIMSNGEESPFKLLEPLTDYFDIRAVDNQGKDLKDVAILSTRATSFVISVGKKEEGKRMSLILTNKTSKKVINKSFTLPTSQRTYASLQNVPPQSMTPSLIDKGWNFFPQITVSQNSVVNTNIPVSNCRNSTVQNNREVKFDNTDYYLICHAEELRPFIFKSSQIRTQKRSNLILGNHLDFNKLSLKPDEVLLAHVIDGNGYEIRNINRVGAEITFSPLFNVNIFMNIGFRKIQLLLPSQSSQYFIHTLVAQKVYFDEVTFEVADTVSRGQYLIAASYLNEIAMTRTEILTKGNITAALYVVNGKPFSNRDVRDYLPTALQDELTRNQLSIETDYSFLNKFYGNLSLRDNGVPGSRLSRGFISPILAKGSARNCWNSVNFDFKSCTNIVNDVLINGSLKSHRGASGLFAYEATSSSNRMAILNSSSYIDIQSTGDGVGGLIYTDTTFRFFNAGAGEEHLMYNVLRKGDTRGRNHVGGVANLFDPSWRLLKVTATGNLVGSEFLGTLAGEFESRHSHGALEISTVNLSGISLNPLETTQNVGVFGEMSIRPTKRIFLGPENTDEKILLLQRNSNLNPYKISF